MTEQTADQTYIVAGKQPWNRGVFDEIICKYPGSWHYIETPDCLTLETVETLQPRYLFFLHWSSKVPEDLIGQYECVCFHMTDLPYGRGGSPLQNLILRGHRQTRLTALQMVADFDAGPVYDKRDLSLEGNAEEIYIRATYLSAEMIGQIVAQQPDPVPQCGPVEIFKRRKPEESEIPDLASLKDLYDFIRMLDAEGYPKAFLTNNGFRYEFSRAALYHNRISVDVSIKPVEQEAP